MADTELIRLNKYMSEAGFCSRREADRLIEAGKVCVDGIPAVMGQKVLPGQQVECEGHILSLVKETVLIAYNKPLGVECTTAADNPDNIISRIGYPERIYPIGRLDKNSTGLILLTNDGSLVNAILKSANDHEKEYEVQVNRPVTDAFISRMSAGVDISGVDGRGNVVVNEQSKDGTALSARKQYYSVTKPCKIWAIGKYSFRIILTQGLNRQIRRMCQVFGYKVISLKRVRVMNIESGDLPEDKWRHVTAEEEVELRSQLHQ